MIWLRRILVGLLSLQAAILAAHFGHADTAPMTVLVIEGFDHLAAAQLTNKGWSANANSVQTGRFGGQSMLLNSTAVRTKTLSSSSTTMIAGFAVKFQGVAGTGVFFSFRNGASEIATLNLTAGGLIVVKNSGGTTIATGTTALVALTWYYMELKIFANGASGTCELHLNGVTEIASTTGNFGSTAIDTIRFSSYAASADTYLDDIYVLNTSGGSPRNTFLGDVRVNTIVPTSDGNYSQWTANPGSTHYTNVDDSTVPDDDTTYNSDSTVGHIDTYGCSDVDGGASVYGVQVNLWARKDDAGTRQIAPLIRQASTDYVGTTVTLGSTYAFYSQVYDQDPAAADWTATNVNSDEFGVKTIA